MLRGSWGLAGGEVSLMLVKGMRMGEFADLCTRLQHVFEVVVWPSIQLSPTTLLKPGDALPWYGLRKLGMWTVGGHNWAGI